MSDVPIQVTYESFETVSMYYFEILYVIKRQLFIKNFVIKYFIRLILKHSTNAIRITNVQMYIDCNP